jgi:hypothetical protein
VPGLYQREQEQEFRERILFCYRELRARHELSEEGLTRTIVAQYPLQARPGILPAAALLAKAVLAATRQQRQATPGTMPRPKRSAHGATPVSNADGG